MSEEKDFFSRLCKEANEEFSMTLTMLVALAMIVIPILIIIAIIIIAYYTFIH